MRNVGLAVVLTLLWPQRVSHIEALLHIGPGGGGGQRLATVAAVNSLEENIYLVEAELDDKLRLLETQLLAVQGGPSWGELPPPPETIEALVADSNLQGVSEKVRGLEADLAARLEEFAAQKQAQEGLWQMFALFQEQHAAAMG